eukprot:scaffold200178_cov51-Attheya_sp.AAC.1
MLPIREAYVTGESWAVVVGKMICGGGSLFPLGFLGTRALGAYVGLDDFLGAFVGLFVGTLGSAVVLRLRLATLGGGIVGIGAGGIVGIGPGCCIFCKIGILGGATVLVVLGRGICTWTGTGTGTCSGTGA